MRQRCLWPVGLTVALGLCVAGATLAEEPGSDPGWWSRVFGRGSSAPAIRKEEKREDQPASRVPSSGSRPTAQADYWRRLEVCDRLREIAFQTGDSDLMRKVDQLEQRVSDAYVQQSKHATAPIRVEDGPKQAQTAPKSERTPLLGSKMRASDNGAAEGRP